MACLFCYTLFRLNKRLGHYIGNRKSSLSLIFPANLMTLAERRDSFRLSMNSPTGAGAGSAPTPSGRSCATFTTITRTCGPGCWNSRPSPARPRRSSTAPSASRTSTPSSGRKIRARFGAPHEVQDNSSGRFYEKRRI